MNGDIIANIVATCLILHNMSVQDHVCGIEATIYDPADGIGSEPYNMHEVATPNLEEGNASMLPLNDLSTIGMNAGLEHVSTYMMERWNALTCGDENSCLVEAAIDHIYNCQF